MVKRYAIWTRFSERQKHRLLFLRWLVYSNRLVGDTAADRQR